MADNYVENHHNDYLKAKAKKEAARRHRQHLYLEAYRKRLKQQKEGQKEDKKSNNSNCCWITLFQELIVIV